MVVPGEAAYSGPLDRVAPGSLGFDSSTAHHSISSTHDFQPSSKELKPSPQPHRDLPATLSTTPPLPAKGEFACDRLGDGNKRGFPLHDDGLQGRPSFGDFTQERAMQLLC